MGNIDIENIIVTYGKDSVKHVIVELINNKDLNEQLESYLLQLKLREEDLLFAIIHIKNGTKIVATGVDTKKLGYSDILVQKVNGQEIQIAYKDILRIKLVQLDTHQ